MVAQVNRSIMHPVQIVQGVSNAPYAYRSLVQWFDCINFVRAIDDATGIGVIDDFLLGPIGAIISKGLEMVAA